MVLKPVREVLVRKPKRVSNEAKVQVDKARRKAEQLKAKMKWHVSRENVHWIKNREYSDYNQLFRRFLGADITEFIQKMSVGLKRPIRILDDGAGYGFFLNELKKNLSSLGVSSHTTALVLDATDVLKELVRKKYVDELYEGPAEYYLPKEEYDLIFSLYGSIHYTQSTFAREILLKYCRSLSKGGYAVIGLTIPLSTIFNIVRVRDAVKNSLNKQGFQADFYESGVPWDSNLPSIVLIVKRIR
jgi:SAM-dependent methyltransferase